MGLGTGISGDSSIITTVDSLKDLIHRGRVFEGFYKFTLQPGTNMVITMEMGSDKYVHYIPTRIVTSADSVTMIARENVVIQGGTGTIIPAVNHNRISTNVSTMVNRYAPTVLTQGNIITQAWLPGGVGVGQSRSGTSGGQDNEWILKKDSVSSLTFYNDSTEVNTIQINAIWYELDYIEQD